MTELEKAARLALEALEWEADYDTSVTLQKAAITALRRALEQPAHIRQQINSVLRKV